MEIRHLDEERETQSKKKWAECTQNRKIKSNFKANIEHYTFLPKLPNNWGISYMSTLLVSHCTKMLKTVNMQSCSHHLLSITIIFSTFVPTFCNWNHETYIGTVQSTKSRLSSQCPTYACNGIRGREEEKYNCLECLIAKVKGATWIPGPCHHKASYAALNLRTVTRQKGKLLDSPDKSVKKHKHWG